MNRLGHGITGLAILAWTLPLSTWAQRPEPVISLPTKDTYSEQSRIHLQFDQQLSGQFVQLFRPGEGLRQRQKIDGQGLVSFEVSAEGAYHVTSPLGATVVRVWSRAAAPPHARQLVTFKSQAPVVRGQNPFCAMFAPEPVMLGLLLAAAIAVPLAVHDGGDDPPGS